MEITIAAIVFILTSINPAIAISQWLGLFSFKNERNIKILKILQTINGVASIALLVLVFTLFDGLATGRELAW